MRLIDKFIIYTTIFSLFSEDFNFRYIIHWKLFYLILFVNFILLAFMRNIRVHKNFIYILGFFAVHGLIMFLFLSNPITSLLSQLLGISLCSIYFYSFLKTYNFEYIYTVYLNTALILSVLAIPMFFLGINSFDSTRLNGIMSEPAHYSAIMLPATYVFLKRKEYFKFLIVLFTILLSKSFLGYLGIILIVIIPLVKFKYLIRLLVIFFGLSIISVSYINANWDKPYDPQNVGNQIVRRVKETYESIEAVGTGKFQERANLSSYAVLSNTFITQKTFSNNPLGSGLGSYRHQYDKYYDELTPPRYLITLGLDKINREDAASLFLRLLADFGLFLLGFFVIFFFVGSRLMSGKDFIRQGSVFYLILKLIREGHYFPPEFYFFLLIFLKDFHENPTHTGRLLDT